MRGSCDRERRGTSPRRRAIFLKAGFGIGYERNRLNRGRYARQRFAAGCDARLIHHGSESGGTLVSRRL